MSKLNTPDDSDDSTEQYKSKSQIKREMDALQTLGKQLTELNEQQLAQVPLTDDLLRAILDYKRFKKNEARRRQLQYLGKLMRNIDATAVAAAVHRFDASHKEHVQHFHEVERWRELLLTEPSSLTEFLDQYPAADAQHLRQLLRNAKNKTSDVGVNRKVFRYIREVLEETS